MQHLFTIRNPYDNFNDELELRYAWKQFDKVHACTSVIVATQDAGLALPYEPMLRIPKAVGQQMMDELWNIGIRPSSDRKVEQTNSTWLQDQLEKFINGVTGVK